MAVLRDDLPGDDVGAVGDLGDGRHHDRGVAPLLRRAERDGVRRRVEQADPVGLSRHRLVEVEGDVGGRFVEDGGRSRRR
jgi:hypothetical protein